MARRTGWTLSRNSRRFSCGSFLATDWAGAPFGLASFVIWTLQDRSVDLFALTDVLLFFWSHYFGGTRIVRPSDLPSKKAKASVRRGERQVGDRETAMLGLGQNSIGAGIPVP